MNKGMMEKECIQMLQNPAFVRENMFIGLQRISDMPILKKPGPFKGTEQYLYVRGDFNDLSWRARVNEKLLENCGITAEDAFALSARNTCAEGMTVIESLPGMLSDLIGSPFPADDGNGVQMYVITNPQRFHGSSQLLDHAAVRAYFKATAPECKKLIVIPSSVHECIIVPVTDDADIDLETFNTMVREVNESTVDEADQLADEVFVLPLTGNAEIWQLKEEESERAFMAFSWLKENGYEVERSRYEQVYTFDTDDDLEKIFVRFNIDRPEDFTGHSLSVSDVVVLNGVAYFVDSVGFQKVSGWEKAA